MALPDNGGFDLVIEIAESTLTAVARTLVPAPSQGPFSNANVTGTVQPTVQVGKIALTAPSGLALTLDLTGTTILISKVVLFGAPFDIPADQQLISLPGSATFSGVLSMSGSSLVADFREGPGVPEPAIDPSIKAAVLDSLPVKFIIAKLMLNGALLDAAKDLIAQSFREQLILTIRGALTANGPIVVVPAPAIPPPSRPVSSAAFLIGPSALVMLYTLGGVPGIPSLITRSSLMRNAGVPTDAAAVVLSNACFLRDFLRPAITALVPLAPGGFNATHPLFWMGAAPLPLPAGTAALISSATLTMVAAGIDGTNLRVLTSVTVTDSGGAFSAACTVDTALSLTAGTGTAITVAVPPGMPPTVTTNISIAPWVYVAAAFTGGAVLVAIFASIDAFGNLLVDRPIGAAIGAALPAMTVPLALPAGAPPVSISAISLFQSDSVRRTITLFPGIITPDPFPSHDIIMGFV